MRIDFDEILRAIDRGKIGSAEEMCRKLLAEQPQSSRALHIAGLVELAKGNLEPAAELMAQSIQLNGDAPDCHNNFGAVLRRLGRVDEAIKAFQRAVDLDPISFDAALNLVRSLAASERFTEAEGMLRRAIAIRPRAADAHVALAGTLSKQHRFEEALGFYSASLKLKPSNEFETVSAIALLMEKLGRMTEAVEWHRRAAALRPGTGWLDSNYLYAIRYCIEEYDPQRVFAEHASWAKKFARPLYESLPSPTNDPSPNRRLRIAYISADFCGHSASTCMEPLIHSHDRTGWEVWCYSDVARPDVVTERFKSAADQWVDVHGLSDERVARLIRAAGIDVLIDHTGHMGNNRMMVFARRAAPVQVAFPGYPGTTGLEVIDAFITDEHQDPVGAERFYTEKLLRFPISPRCYRAPQRAPEVGPLPADSLGHVTFGVIQRPAKLTARMFSLWSQILKRVPNSKLLMLLGPGRAGEKHFGELLRRSDIPPNRVELVGRQKRDGYFGLFARVDLMLDTMPYSGCATSLDSLWMGVPVITLAGKTYVSRVGASILAHVGYSELVASSEADYIKIASDLAADRTRLQMLRQTLRSRMTESSLLDARRVTSELEQACRTLWREWCDGQRNRSNLSR